MLLLGDGGSLVFLPVILRVKFSGLIMGWPRIRVNKSGFNIDDSPQRTTVPILLAYDNRIMSVRDDARNRCLDTLHIGLITEDGAEVQPKPITIRMVCDGLLASTKGAISTPQLPA
jgi:hypothetical protein